MWNTFLLPSLKTYWMPYGSTVYISTSSFTSIKCLSWNHYSVIWHLWQWILNRMSLPNNQYLSTVIMVVSYRHFWTTYWSHLPGSISYSWTAWPLKVGPICCPRTSVQNYHSVLHKYQKSADLIDTVEEAWNHAGNFCYISYILAAQLSVGVFHLDISLRVPFYIFWSLLSFYQGCWRTRRLWIRSLSSCLKKQMVDETWDLEISQHLMSFGSHSNSSIGSITTHTGCYYAKTTGLPTLFLHSQSISISTV
jgi:hypothetical protein